MIIDNFDKARKYVKFDKDNNPGLSLRPNHPEKKFQEMGQTYSVILKTGFKDKKGAKKALLDRIAKGDEDHTDYNLDHYRQIGIGTDTIEDLMKIFFGGWQGKLVP